MRNHLRYCFVLDKSEHTERVRWGQVYYSSNKITELISAAHSQMDCQPWHILDSKTNTVISKDRFWEIIHSINERK